MTLTLAAAEQEERAAAVAAAAKGAAAVAGAVAAGGAVQLEMHVDARTRNGCCTGAARGVMHSTLCRGGRSRG